MRRPEETSGLERSCQRDYDAEVPRRCRELGLARSYAVVPRVKADPRVQRGNLMRTLGLEVG